MIYAIQMALRFYGNKNGVKLLQNALSNERLLLEYKPSLRPRKDLHHVEEKS